MNFKIFSKLTKYSRDRWLKMTLKWLTESLQNKYGAIFIEIKLVI